MKFTLKQALVALGTAALLGSAILLAVWSVKSGESTDPAARAPFHLASADSFHLTPGTTAVSWNVVFNDVR